MHFIKNLRLVENGGFLPYNVKQNKARIQEFFIWISANINEYIAWE